MTRIWSLLTIAVAVVTAAAPGYVMYDLYDRGAIPEKRVDVYQLSVVDPLRDLTAVGNKVSVKFSFGDATLHHLAIITTVLRNAGKTPILPNEYHENLSINAEPPWKIVAVDSSEGTFGARLRWQRASDTRFEAQPALLNPGDVIFTNVYMTNTQYLPYSEAKTQPEPRIEWRARIVQLKGFSEPPGLMRSETAIFSVHLFGWAVIFSLLAALLFQAFYLHLLYEGGFLRQWGWESLSLILGTSFLSVAASVSSATYLFPTFSSRILGVNHWGFAPWLIIHVGVLVVLWVRRSRRPKF